ncbi:origin recognition complex subunit 1 [Sporothrix schenckii 1099-18]|uniref:Origin recognition complex subunit 1 n=1 Tax=Sporothrix schenckii 1099-18 TaxID=1397361 RepID=A0A0F2M394_SPOSC|nr:origin recognition complex subunit 1 [Sporothrix schenckii 1099-18]KJR82611.1 origin recognition complex subunit 1 [Sporothrix schenckii 1099-18]
MPLLKASQKPARKRRTPAIVPGIARDDSDDELGDLDHPWEWIYAADKPSTQRNGHESSRKRKRPVTGSSIVGARMGDFECFLGDTVLLKAEGSNEAWVGIICEFIDDDGDDGEKAAHFMWFSTEKEIRNKVKKRTDFLPNELYISPSWDVNPLTSINGSANVMSPAVFRMRFPSGRLGRQSTDYGKTFICRRGCNTRTASYTDEFVWEDIYKGTVEDIEHLVELVKTGTKASRKRRQTKNVSADLYDYQDDVDDSYNEPKDTGGEKELRTPKKTNKSFEDATTPTSKRPKSTSKLLTPSHRRVVLKKHLEFTPLATRTLSPNHYLSSPFQKARAQLHIAAVPASLPCRESEFSLVYSHLEAAITEGTGSCIYISGTPGTGKTATVREVVSSLDFAVQSDELDDFIFVEINGMKITDPHQAYSLLWEALKGQRVSPGQALDLLEHEFSNPSPRRVPCVVLMDELDQLVTKNQGVMYNFFNWPGLRHSRLIVLAVANTMDLPERTLSNKISSRLGLTRITFPGYTHEQLMKIIQSRLEGVPGATVDPDAIQFASRKVAAVSGDARRALDICRRAVELAETESRQQEASSIFQTHSKGSKDHDSDRDTTKRSAVGRVTIDTIRRAIAEATSSPLQQYLRALPFSSRLLLAALLARTQRTGIAESTFGDVLEETQRALRFAVAVATGTKEGRPLEALLTGRNLTDSALRKQAAALAAARGVRLAGLGSAAVELAGAGIVYLEGHRVERPGKIRLAIGDEDVKLAFRDDPEVKAAGLSP